MEFNFDENIILENDHVLLRPLATTDFEHLIQFSLSEPQLWEHSLIQAIGETGLRNYLQLAVDGREAKREYPFIVFDKRKQAFAGSSRYYDIQLANDSLQLGYTWYGKQFQRTGLNKHCKYLLLEYAFEKKGAERVEFRADLKNERSIAAMKSIGCIVEGVLRSNGRRTDGTLRDSIVLSILKHEWEGGVKAMLWSKIIFGQSIS